MLILTLLVSNLILVYNLIIFSRNYVEKLAPVAQSSVFKCWTLISLKEYYDYHSTNTIFCIGLSTCITVLFHHIIVQ